MVKSREGGMGRLRKLQDSGGPARPDHAAHLREAGFIIGQVAETERYRDQVERSVAQRQA